MGKMLILKTQANEIFDAIRNKGLDPIEFEWQECDSIVTRNIKVSRLAHRPSGFYFIFDFSKSSHYAEFSPGVDSIVKREYPGSWMYQKEYVIKWLDSLKKEIEAPDLWNIILQEKQLTKAAIDSTVNSCFTEEEKSHIAEAMNNIQNYLLTTQNFEDKYVKFIEDRLNYLKEAADRQGRQDWLHTVIGVLFTIVMGTGLSSERARELFRFVANSLQNLLVKILPLS
jgi:hypothetical protein